MEQDIQLIIEMLAKAAADRKADKAEMEANRKAWQEEMALGEKIWAPATWRWLPKPYQKDTWRRWPAEKRWERI
jgi:hypothetical protein